MPETKRSIINELKDLNKLREVLEIVNTILAILAKPTTAHDAYRPISEYAEEVLHQKLPDKVYTFIVIHYTVISFV